MKRSIRRGVFETNSSSSHSLVIHPGWDKVELREDYSDCFRSDPYGEYILCEACEFGWGPDSVDTTQEKLEYLLAMTMSNCDSWVVTWNQYSEMNDFKKLEEWVREHTKFKGIRIPNHRGNGVYEEDEEMTDGMYVDHQSMYPCIDAFLEDWGLTLTQYLLDNNVFVIIDNDNH